ncbi:MAG: DUF4388 domain-containing protein [Actinomycetota bacterium]
MALQGTLDTFALPDVLHLLATTKKTGCLRLEGRRGIGTVHVDAGEVVAVSAAHAPLATDPADALFELLRFDDGAFSFEADAAPDERGPATDVESLLEAATGLLAEWREIEAVVPSLDAHISLRSALGGDDVTIPAHQWAHLVAIGGGRTVRALGEHLELAELPVSRVVRDLLELGVVELEEREPVVTEDPAPAVDEASAEPSEPAAAEPSDAERSSATEPEEPSSELAPPPPPPAAPQPGASDDESAAPLLGSITPAEGDTGETADETGLPVARPIKARRPRPRLLEASDEPERFVPLDLPGHRSTPAATSGASGQELDDLTAAFPGLATRGGLSADEDAAVSVQLAALSPEVADAVLAAAEEPDEESVAAALDEAVEGEEAPINRGLLLKFLGSARS